MICINKEKQANHNDNERKTNQRRERRRTLTSSIEDLCFLLLRKIEVKKYYIKKNTLKNIFLIYTILRPIVFLARKKYDDFRQECINDHAVLSKTTKPKRYAVVV